MPENNLAFTSRIVSAFLAKNQTSKTDLTVLIQTVHTALAKSAAPPAEPAPAETPAVTVRRSVTPDAILCMNCGKPFKSLKRHLATHDLSPEGYRTKWSLPKTYPMVAPAYSAARSAMAKSIGLGARGRPPVLETGAADAVSVPPEAHEVAEAQLTLQPKARTRAAARPKANPAKPKRSNAAKPSGLSEA